MRRRNVFAMGLALAIGGAGAAFLVDDSVAAPPPLLQLLSPPGAGYDSTNGVLYAGSGGAVTFTRADTWTCRDSDGTIRSLASGAPCVVDGHDGAGSLRVRSAVTNVLLRSAALDDAAWGDVNTPVVTANSWDFGTGAATGETIADDSVSSEGRAQSVATTTVGAWTGSCFMQAGTETTARIILTVAGGSGTATCTITGLTSATSRQTCTITAGAGVTAITPSVLVGDDGTDVGTIKVGGCQLVAGSQPGDYCPTGASSDTCAAETATVATPAGLSRTEGCTKVCITPSWTGANPLSTSVFFLSGNSALTARFLYTGGSASLISGFDGTSTPGVEAGYVSGVRKCYLAQWSAAGNYYRVSNLASGATFESTFSTFPAFDASIDVGSRSTGANQANASLDSIVFGSHPNGCQ